MSSGGYHHHVSANTCRSPGASLRDLNRAGLAWFAFEAEDDKAYDASAAKLKAAGIPTSNGTNGLEFAARTDLSRMRDGESHDIFPLQSCDVPALCLARRSTSTIAQGGHAVHG